MKKLLLLSILATAFSCGKTETVYLFKKGSAEYNARAAFLAEQCASTDNKRLVENLDKASTMENIIQGTSGDVILRIKKYRKIDDGSKKEFFQFIRLYKDGDQDKLRVRFLSTLGSSTDSTQTAVEFEYTSAHNKEIQNEIITGVCSTASNSYTGSLKGSGKEALSFGDKRTSYFNDNIKDFKRSQQDSFTIFANIGSQVVPAILYKWSGTEVMIDYEQGEENKEKDKITYGKESNQTYQIVNLNDCRSNQGDNAGCDTLFTGDPNAFAQRTLCVQKGHALNNNPDTYLTYYTAANTSCSGAALGVISPIENDTQDNN